MGSSRSKNAREAEREVDDAHDGNVLTPEERLLLNDRMIRAATELRSGFGFTRNTRRLVRRGAWGL